MGEWGKEGVKLCLSKMNDGGSSFFSELCEVELGNGAEGFDGGCGSKWGWGADHVGVGIDGGRLEGVQVNEGDASAS